MNIILAEAISTDLVQNEKGQGLCHARVLSQNSPKYNKLVKLFEQKCMSEFIKITDYMFTLVNYNKPFVIVTDWTDPTEMVGLRLESDGENIDYPDLCFLTFYTDWEDTELTDMRDIFSHELSHFWIHSLGYDFNLSKSNIFHTSTAVTDRFMAFSEGFAEHLQIVTQDLIGIKPQKFELWDSGYDVEAWLCSRDAKLRENAVKNNRFIYHTVEPNPDEYKTYNELHMDHITSSIFTPQNIKTGNQMMSSEGVIASIFYAIYCEEKLQNTYMDESFYQNFGAHQTDINPIINLYLKIIYALSKIDLKSDKLMTDFITKYSELYPNEKELMYETFLKVTHFSTVSDLADEMFGKLYTIGKRGDISDLKEKLSQVREWRKDLLNKVTNHTIKLDNRLKNEIWITGDKEITPVPWISNEKVKINIEINTASEIDFMALDSCSYEKSKQIVKKRESLNGFSTIDEFYKVLNS